MYFSDAINKNNKMDIKDIEDFLNRFDVKYDYPEKTFVIRDKGRIISTGSIDGNVLKYFFTDCNYKGEGTISVIYNSLLNYLIDKGEASYFVFTSPKNKEIFSSLGLDLVEDTEDVSLLEGGFYNYKKWINEVENRLEIKDDLKKKEESSKENLKTKDSKKYKLGSIVVNCNPMTLGHKYLIEKALDLVDELIVFLVEEDRSDFSFEDRWSIINKEFKNNKRVKIIPSGPYIISRATFPTYFLKEEDDKLDIYTRLDASIFGKKISKDLGIDIRFLGTEPIDTLTRTYNKNIKNILEGLNIKVEVVERKSFQGEIISASKVRRLLASDKPQEAYKYLPQSTIEFLESVKGIELIKKLQKKEAK